jgi:threonine synthase
LYRAVFARRVQNAHHDSWGDIVTAPGGSLIVNGTAAAEGTRSCPACGSVYPLWGLEFRCSCGSPLAWSGPGAGARAGGGIWRYADLLPPVADVHRLTLGEEVTPAIRVDELVCKLDYLLPTGSFKDRGAAVLTSCALEAGISAAVADSSGNAGASLAAYFTSAGVPLTVFVPRGSSSPKLEQARRYGARVEEVEGGRSAASDAAVAFAAERGAFYASHAWSPFFIAGMRTLAFELCSQLGPDLPAVVVPVGAGTLLLGLAQGFALLAERGEIATVPRLLGVQAAACAPLADAFATGRDGVDPSKRWTTSLAGGINIPNPPRAPEILAAVRSSGGAIVTVAEQEIATAREELGRRGVLVEHTSAAAWAGAAGAAAAPGGSVVVLTGFGLKEAL